MKRTSICLSLCFVVLVIGFEKQPAMAQAGECNSASYLLQQGSTDSRKHMEPIGKADITVDFDNPSPAERIRNVVVVGQDPEEEGVYMKIIIKSQMGTILHDGLMDEVVCSSKTKLRREDKACGFDYHDGTPYYPKTVQTCHRFAFSKDIARNITKVLVWLQPSDETQTWLDWLPSDTASNSKSSLRYIFPDKWMTGTWTEDGFVTSGTPDRSWSETYYQNWLQQMQDFNFLSGDSQTIPYLWSVTLDEVPGPETKDSTVTSLGLFGDFTLSKPPVGYYFPSSHSVITYDVINGNTEKGRARSYPASPNLNVPYSSNVTIELFHVPLDLPGMWYVGVAVEMSRATFTVGNTNFTEETDSTVWGTENIRLFTPDELGYDLRSNIIYSYVLLSSPCNDLEQNNCWDNTY